MTASERFDQLTAHLSPADRDALVGALRRVATLRDAAATAILAEQSAHRDYLALWEAAMRSRPGSAPNPHRTAMEAAMREDDAMRVDGAIAKQRTGTGQGCEAADYEQRFTPADERDARLEKGRAQDAEGYDK